VTLNGWDVAIVDKGSAHGTLVLTPGESEWVRLMGGRSVVMPPGTRIAVGSRALQFESHHVGS
jgi:hypothetical protein